VYRNMDQWAEIRQRVLVDGESKRTILRETGMHWTTLEKILSESEPADYQLRQPRPKPVIGPYLEQIQQILKEDRHAPRKQRHSAMRIFKRIRDAGYVGGYTQVKEAVNELRQTSQEVFMPLLHKPGEAQVDFGHAYVKEHGALKEVAYFVMSLPHSDAMFVKVYERECTESFWDGHNQAFAFFGGVPWRISYDNTSIAVKEIAGRERALTTGFLRLQSHYLFKAHFCQPARGNEKGVVEGAVGFARRNFMVPVPEISNGLEGVNAQLLEQCRSDMERQLRGQDDTKAELLKEDQSAFRELPAVPFEGCRKLSTASNSLSLVRFDHNDYSVPVEYAHRMVVVKGFVDRVEICRLTETIAMHPRLWTKEDISFDPLHYLALLERKPGALEHARPLSGWQLPECFEVLKRRLEDELEADGKREYIRVLRLLEKHSQEEVARAIERGLAIRAHTRDALAQFLVPQEEWRATTFNLDGHPHLRLVKVESANLFAYRELRQAGGSQ
jgi:transposase